MRMRSQRTNAASSLSGRIGPVRIVHLIESGIFPGNTASLALHRAAGFGVVGTQERIGQHHRRWRDVMLIERRSPAL
jgi:L-amino acid N-acyltransferase YncA